MISVSLEVEATANGRLRGRLVAGAAVHDFDGMLQLSAVVHGLLEVDPVELSASPSAPAAPGAS
jgi:hypothetical protein